MAVVRWHFCGCPNSWHLYIPPHRTQSDIFKCSWLEQTFITPGSAACTIINLEANDLWRTTIRKRCLYRLLLQIHLFRVKTGRVFWGFFFKDIGWMDAFLASSCFFWAHWPICCMVLADELLQAFVLHCTEWLPYFIILYPNSIIVTVFRFLISELSYSYRISLSYILTHL